MTATKQPVKRVEKMTAAKTTKATSKKSKRVTKATKKNTATKRKSVTKKPTSTATSKRPQATHQKAKATPYQALLGASKVLTNPVPILPMMQATARASGMFFVVFGALYALYFAQFLYSDTSAPVALPIAATQLAQTITTESDTKEQFTTITDTADDELVETTEIVSPTNLRPAAQFAFEPSGTFRDMVRVVVRVPDAASVELVVFLNTYTKQVPLGSATQVGLDTWEFMWNTNQYQTGNYRLAADITNQYVQNKPYRSSHHSYILLDNSEPEPEPEIDVANNDTIVPKTVTESVLDTNEQGEIINVTTTNDTENIDERTLREKRDAAYTERQLNERQINTNDTDTDDERKTVETETTSQPPEATVSLSATQPVTGTIPVRISSTPARAVEVYVQSRSNQTLTRRFIGVATKQTEDTWVLQYDTTQTPNGSYRIVAIVKGMTGQFDASSADIVIQNKIKTEPRTIQEDERVENLRIEKKIDDTKGVLPVQPVADDVTQPSSTATTIQTVFADAFSTIEADLDKILRTIEIADVYNSEIDKDSLFEKLRQLRDRLLEKIDNAEDPVAYREFVLSEFDTILETERQRIQTERREREVTGEFALDSDFDGVSDFDEINIFGTDPFNPDSDNDGVLDGIEIMRGTDPLAADTAPEVYESPQEAGIERSDLLQVDTVSTATTSSSGSANTNSEEAKTTAALITGRAIPNSFVTLYIFSQPTVVTVRTAADGSWQYRFEKELADGTHTVYAALTDHAGRVVAKSEPFSFIKEAEAFFAPGSVVQNQSQSDSSIFSSYVFYMMMSLSVISLGLVLMMIGFHIQHKRRSDEAYGTV